MTDATLKLDESVVQRNYLYHTAGRIWIIPKVEMFRNPDGTLGISFEEIDRIQKAVANEICGNAKFLSGVEFEFLCDATSTKFVEVAEKFSISKGNVSHWTHSKSPISFERSVILKRWFWSKLFGEKITSFSWELPKVIKFVDDDLFFQTMKSIAIDSGLTFEVRLAS